MAREIVSIEGNFDDALRIVREFGNQGEFAIVNSINPDRIAGQKTAAFEIVDDLGDAPNIHILPLGNAGNLTAYAAGYSEYKQLGKSRGLPRMIGIQAEHAAPIFHRRVIEKPETIASAIRIGNPASWEAAQRAIDDSGGAVEIVTDREILEAQSWLAQTEGIFVEPASAAPIAGLFKFAREKRRDLIPKDATVVCTCTGHGLKDPRSCQLNFPKPRRWRRTSRPCAKRSHAVDRKPTTSQSLVWRAAPALIKHRDFMMRLIVQKYGGTSVGDTAKICNVARRLLETQRDGCRVVAVISAMAGVTDNLIKLAREVSPQPTPRELDLLLATGECAASALIAMAVNALGGRAVSLTGAEAGILTDRVHSKAKIANISPRQIHYLLNEDYIVVVAGFQGQTNEGETTTLGRGGSDLTAIALAGALNADACQIFTDVDGVFTCDPRLIGDAKKIDEISYDELLEMAGAGSKVMQSRAVEFAKKFCVRV